MGAISNPAISRDTAMVFVDGSNLVRELGKQLGVDWRADLPSDIALNAAALVIAGSFGDIQHDVVGSIRVVRRYWFGAIQGNDETINAKRVVLRAAGYEPMLFRKTKGGREKGVDLAVAEPC